jgi:hypothetical protein
MVVGCSLADTQGMHTSPGCGEEWQSPRTFLGTQVIKTLDKSKKGNIKCALQSFLTLRKIRL